MRKKIILAAAFTIGSLLCVHSYVFTNINGAVSGVSGGPGNLDCRDCHTGTFNSANGSLTIQLLDPSNGNAATTTYLPGKTYNIKVDITFPGISDYGFETSVRQSSTHVGTLAPGTNSKFTDVNHKYLTHTTPQTTGSWTFSWTAPSTNIGKVTIYTAGNAANGDHTSNGDNIYVKALAISPDPSVGIDENTLFGQNISLFPNPVVDYLTINYFTQEAAQAQFTIYDLNGKVLSTKQDIVKPGAQQQYLDMTTLPSGVYLVRIEAAGNSAIKKVFKQ